MIAYFDTSALIPLLMDESASETAGDLWLSATRIVASRLIFLEACSALARATRGGRLRRSQYKEARNELVGLIEQIDHVEVTPEVTLSACAMTNEYELRAYDAVHLASASILNDPELVFVTNDERLQGAALLSGLNAAIVS